MSLVFKISEENKDYFKDLLWLLNFYEYEQGMVNYSKVEEHLNSCRYNSKLVENSIRTTRNIDV